MTDRNDETRAWLATSARPGLPVLRLAAGSQVLETVFTVVQWTGLAWLAQDILHRRTQPIWGLALLAAGGLVAAVATWGAARLQAVARRRITHAIRKDLVAHLLQAGPQAGEPDNATAGLATVELADDVADHHAQALPLRLSAPGSMAVILIVTATVQWPAAVILLLASLLVPVNMRLAGLFAKEGADERVAASSRLSSVVLDSFRGMRTLRSIGALERRRAQLADADAQLNATTMGIMRRAFLSGSVMEVVITFSIAADATYIGLSLLGYIRLDFAPQVTLFTGLLALLLCPMYFAPLRAMAAAYHSRERAAAGAPTIMALLAEPTPAPEISPTARPDGPVTIAVDGVSFQASGGSVLQPVDLTVRPGEWTAVTGSSGAGKTTLLSLIAGARRPTSGTIRWITPEAVVPPYLGGCAWIGQHTVILPGTIADNIRLGRTTASLAEIEAAAAGAGLTEVIERLPDGFDTVLGERGWGLSTGEARRVAIARAFLRDATLWVLDEPTAHLDAESELKVIDALRITTQGRTVIVATHSTILAHCADTVLTIADRTVHAAQKPTPV